MTSGGGSTAKQGAEAGFDRPEAERKLYVEVFLWIKKKWKKKKKKKKKKRRRRGTRRGRDPKRRRGKR